MTVTTHPQLVAPLLLAGFLLGLFVGALIQAYRMHHQSRGLVSFKDALQFLLTELLNRFWR